MQTGGVHQGLGLWVDWGGVTVHNISTDFLRMTEFTQASYSRSSCEGRLGWSSSKVHRVFVRTDYRVAELSSSKVHRVLVRAD